MVGRTLQRYHLLEEVGHGGMAVVYRGQDESLEREVAVKLLHPHLSKHPEYRRRLAREAKAVARLHHPNILEIFDFSSEEGDDAYLVTELIHGPTLRTFAVEHPFTPPELAAACVHDLAGALAHAHANGIVHRDVKPENVMIQLGGPVATVKLMDFGIAQILDRDERMTVTGSLMGSPAHMAPEIIDGEEADERSDIFSLGTILYWLVTGVLPFDGSSPGALLKSVLAGEFEDPRMLKPDVSDCLAKIIAGCLARNRSERIANAQELQVRLAACLEEVGITRPSEMLSRFLANPSPVSQETRGVIIAHLLRQGEEASAAKKTGKALSAYGRVISIAPGTPEAGAAREAIDRMNTRLRWRRRAVGALAATAVASSVAAAWEPAHRWMTTRHVAPVAVAAPPRVPLQARQNTLTLGSPEVTQAVPVEPPRPVGHKREQQSGKVHPVAHQVTVAALEPASRPPDVDPRPKIDARIASEPPASVAVQIRGAYPWTSVSIDDGKPMDRLSKEPFSVPAGKHRFTFSNPSCCEDITVDGAVDAANATLVVPQLLPKPARVAVEAHGAPSNAQVRLDDKELGAIGTDGVVRDVFGFPDKTYDRMVVVRLFVEGDRKAEQTVKLSAGQSTRVRLTMGSCQGQPCSAVP